MRYDGWWAGIVIGLVFIVGLSMVTTLDLGKMLIAWSIGALIGFLGCVYLISRKT